MNRRKALTLVEVLVVVAILGAVVAFAAYLLMRPREEARRLRCANNLNQLAKGMATYCNDWYYPWLAGRVGCGGTESADAADFGGAEWLASLYWTRTLPDPGVFVCPSSGDTNADGRDLGDHGCRGPGFQAGPDGKLKAEAVSYAGMADTSVAIYDRVMRKRPNVVSKEPILEHFPQDKPMACDDTEGTINHGRKGSAGMCVLFFDGHVEFWSSERVDLEHGVGEKELVYLRN